MMTDPVEQPKVLVLGGNGKTGRRVVERLKKMSYLVTGVSRSTVPAFDWQADSGAWEQLFTGFQSIYITYQPDLAIPQAQQDIRRLVSAAQKAGVHHLVLLSGRGEPGAQQAEKIVANSGMRYHVIRASWFKQNFNEGFIAEMLNQGVVALPQGDVLEPFIDAEDIADAVVRCLTDNSVTDGIYEVTGPELLTFKECVQKIAATQQQPVKFIDLDLDTFIQQLRKLGFDDNMLWLMRNLFNEVLDGRNSYLTKDVELLLKRPAGNFDTYASRTFKARMPKPSTPQGEL